MNYHGGVKFDNYLISKENGIYLLDVTEKAIPSPIFEGGVIAGYSDGVIMVSVGIRDFRSSRAMKLKEVLQAITTSKKVQFTDEDTYREIIAIANVDQVWQDPFLQLDITLNTKPFKYVDVPKQTLGSSVINEGNYKAHTLLEVTGNATVNGMSVSGAIGTVYIDSEDKIAYTLNGTTKVNALQFVTGDNFLELAPGNNVISATGNVKITYRHTYLY